MFTVPSTVLDTRQVIIFEWVTSGHSSGACWECRYRWEGLSGMGNSIYEYRMRREMLARFCSKRDSTGIKTCSSELSGLLVGWYLCIYSCSARCLHKASEMISSSELSEKSWAWTLFSPPDLKLPQLVESTLKDLFVSTWIINPWACVAFGTLSKCFSRILSWHPHSPMGLRPCLILLSSWLLTWCCLPGRYSVHLTLVSMW